MSPSVLDRFDANNAEEVMDKENHGQSPGAQTILSSGVRRFSDVTNTLHFSSSRKPVPESFHLAAHLNSKNNAEHFHQEIYYLKKVLAEKEATLESTKQELQKAWYTSYKSSQQNKQLTQTNGQMFAELCMLREKVKLLQHEYSSMSAAFRAKKEELEQTVRDLSDELKRRNQILTKGPEHTEHLLLSDTQRLCSIKNEKSFENSGEVSIGGENSTRVNLAAKEVKTNAKRVSIKRHLASNGKYGMGRGEAESMATVTPIDQSNASFSEDNLEEVFAGGFCKKDYSLPRENGSTKEGDSKDKRTCLRRQLTSSSYKESPVHKKVRHTQKASTTTLDKSDQHIASTSMLETLGDPCTDHSTKEGDSSEGAHVSINEATSNGKRPSLRRRSANISYKEPALNSKLRRQADGCNEPGTFRINLSAIEEKKWKRAGSRQSSANTNHRDSHLKENTQQEEKTVTTPSFSGSQTLDNVGEGHEIGFDVPCSDAVHVELSESDGCKNWNSTNKDVTNYRYPTKVQKQQVQETGHCSASALKTVSETTEPRSSQSASSAPKTVEFVAFSKEIPLGGNGDEVQELHSDVPQPEAAYLSKTSVSPQSIHVSNTESNTIKPPAVHQLKEQSTVPCHASSFNTTLNATQLRRSLAGRPVRKAAETVASYKEIPVNIKMRRSQ